MKWISVKDRLPAHNINVLCTNNKGICYDEKEPFVAHREHESWWCQVNPFNYAEYEDVKVTHWMPLPEPPKEETK